MGNFSSDLLPTSASDGLIEATSTSFVASEGGCSSFGEDATGISAARTCPPPPTSLIVGSTNRSVSGFIRGSSDTGGEGSVGSLPMLGKSANKSGRTGNLDEKVAEVTSGDVAGEISGGGVVVGMADTVGSEPSSLCEDLPFPVFRVEVTRPTSSATSRIPSTRPDSRSSREGFWEGGGDGKDTMSRAVGSLTGRGAGALVTEIAGKLEATAGEGTRSVDLFMMGISDLGAGPCGEILLTSRSNCLSG